MSRVRKRICLALVVIFIMFSVVAQDSVFIGDGDIGGIHIFDSQGVALDVTDEVASNIGQGWIIHNPDTPILIITPKGSINLYEDSILVTGDLISNNPSLYLVKGKATFSTNAMEGGTLSVSTPVSLFKLKGDGEMFVITDDIEESVTVFKGEATSYNSISRASRTIGSFQKLGMLDNQAKAKPIATGYYLTYATYPDLMLAKQLLNEMATAETPSIPKFSSVLQKPQQVEPPAIVQGVTIIPAEAPSFTQVEVSETTIPSKPYTITVTSEAVKVPAIPQTLSTAIVPRLKNRIVVTVRPLAPEIPSVVDITTKVEPLPVSVASDDLTTMPMTVEENVVEEVTASEPVPQKGTISSQEKPQGVLFTQEENIKSGSVGIHTSYSFLFDGTDNNALSHTLSIKPYVTYKSFALTLQSSVSTEDFSLFTSNVTPVPTGTLDTISYGFKYISSFRFGYSSSPFFLALDNNQYHSSLTDHYFAPRFGESSKLGLFNRIEIGSLSTNLYFDDLYLTNFLTTPSKHQFGSFSLEYAKQEGYRFSASIGTLAKIQKNTTWEVELYPNVNLLFPLIDVRTTQLSFLVSASGYLPVYPTFIPEEFVDPTLSTLFPNYQMSTGLSLKQGAFSAKLLGSLRKGKNRNLLTSEIAYALDTSYDSVFDFFAETGFVGEHFNANLTVNIPFASDFTLASLTASSHKADFSQLTLSYKQNKFNFSLGLQQVGIVDILTGIVDGSNAVTTLFGGEWATSFLSVGYTAGDLTLKAKASYPANPTLYTTPKITFTASYKLGVKF